MKNQQNNFFLIAELASLYFSIATVSIQKINWKLINLEEFVVRYLPISFNRCNV